MMSTFNDIFNYFQIGGDQFIFKHSLYKNYQNMARKQSVHTILPYFNRVPGKARFAFVGAKYRGLIKSLNSEGVIIIGNAKQAAASALLGTGFFSQARLYQPLMLSYDEDNSYLLMETISYCAEMIQQWGTEAIITINDSMPIERLWIAAAREAGANSICIQHGLFGAKNAQINDGKYADLMCAFDNWQKSILENSGARNVTVLGYYADINKKRKKRRNTTICILGQPYVDYFANKSSWYISMLVELFEVLKRDCINWKYKPHPYENNWLKYVPGGKKKCYHKSMQKALRDFDVFISFTSTALFEVTLHGKLAIQIWDASTGGYKYSDAVYAHTINSDEMDAIKKLITSGSALNPHIDSRPVKERFMEILNSAKQEN